MPLEISRLDIGPTVISDIVEFSREDLGASNAVCSCELPGVLPVVNSLYHHCSGFMVGAQGEFPGITGGPSGSGTG